MATALTPLVLSLSTSGDNIVPVTAADVAGNTIAWQPGLRLIVKNGDASAHAVTIASQAAATDLKEGIAKADLVVSVGAGATRSIGPIPAAYKDASGLVNVSYAAVTSVTVLAVV